ncbi:hypothetical protein [Mesorhizobium sp. M7A.F.Ca.US.006.01.1.1]|nr:hypothetical protein [Mesorhizobium sp. M7A.F.Ca.US.006.01.1.1]
MRFVIAATMLTLISAGAHAAPPQGAKLSDIIAKVEQTPDIEYIDEVD